MDNNANYVRFIKMIYMQENSSSNRLALMEMFRIFEFAEKCGYNTDLSYETLTALAGFYDEVWEELSKYPLAKREKQFESAETLNRLAAGMYYELCLNGKRAGNHSKAAPEYRESWCDPKLANEWIWTEDYVIAGNTILYMRIAAEKDVVTIPSYLEGRDIYRLGQGSIRVTGERVRKMYIHPGIRMIGALPELSRVSALEFTPCVRSIEIDRFIPATTNIYLRFHSEYPGEAERFKTNSGCRTIDGGYLVTPALIDRRFPKVILYMNRSITHSYDLEFEPEPGEYGHSYGKGCFITLFDCGLERSLSLYEINAGPSSRDIDETGELVRKHLCEKARTELDGSWYMNCRVFYILYEKSGEMLLQMIIGNCCRYEAEDINVSYGGKRYEIFRAYDRENVCGEQLALRLTDPEGNITENAEILHHYLRRVRLVKMLSE